MYNDKGENMYNDVQIEKAQCEVRSLKSLTMIEQTEKDIVELTGTLEKKMKLLALLKRNPEIEEIFSLLRNY